MEGWPVEIFIYCEFLDECSPSLTSACFYLHTALTVIRAVRFSLLRDFAGVSTQYYHFLRDICGKDTGFWRLVF